MYHAVVLCFLFSDILVLNLYSIDVLCIMHSENKYFVVAL
jgi:hypothetical protein